MKQTGFLWLWTILFLNIVTSSGAISGTITEINLSDINDPYVIDFESTSLGPISGTDSLFTNAGISSVSILGGVNDTNDKFSHFKTYNKALANQNGILTVIEPGDGLAQPSGSYQINFSNSHNQFGWYFVDQTATTTATFYYNTTNVGSASWTIPTQGNVNESVIHYFENTDAFNMVTISAPGGFGIDMITFDTKNPVPEPTTMLLFGFGLLALAGERRRKK